MRYFHLLDIIIYAAGILSIIFFVFLFHSHFLLAFMPLFIFALMHSLFSYFYFESGKIYRFMQYSDLSWIEIDFRYERDMKLNYTKLSEGNWVLNVGKFRVEKYKLPF